MDAILRGQYLSAAALVRQELESLAALVEHEGGRRQDGCVPQISVLERSVRRLYGPLSATAHVAHDRLVKQATLAKERWDGVGDDVEVTLHYPQFDRDQCRHLYALHVYLMLQVAVELINATTRAHEIEPTPVVLGAISAILELLIEEGVLERCETHSAT